MKHPLPKEKRQKQQKLINKRGPSHDANSKTGGKNKPAGIEIPQIPLQPPCFGSSVAKL